MKISLGIGIGILCWFILFLSCSPTANSELFASDADVETPSPFPAFCPTPTYVDAGCSPHGIAYNGGKVLIDPIQVHLIWVGDWSNSNTIYLVERFITELSNSDYWKINTNYCQFDGRCVNPVVQLGITSIVPTSTPFTSPGDLIKQIVELIQDNQLPEDNNGVYLILGAKGVAYPGSCTGFCGIHYSHLFGDPEASQVGVHPGFSLKYAFIPSTLNCLKFCHSGSGILSPNDNVEADGMINTFIHELSEMATDPEFNAWINPNGVENGDVCSWTYGTTYTTNNGAVANLHLTDHDYLVQQLWVNRGNGFCGMH